MNVEFLIIGQGIAGSLLSFELIKGGHSVLVIDSSSEQRASWIAGAVLNPVVFKARSSVLNRSHQMESAVSIYKSFEQFLGIAILKQTSLLKFHISKIEKEFLESRIANGKEGIFLLSDFQLQELERSFNAEFGISSVSPVWKVNNTLLLDRWKEYLMLQDSFLEEKFLYDQCEILNSKILYKNIIADKIIFCEGASVVNNPFIDSQIFVANRGDVLLLEIPELSMNYIYQQQQRLIPVNNNLFWMGSNNRWDLGNMQPDMQWKEKSLRELRHWLRLPFKIHAHLVAERPTTAGQKIISGPIPGIRNAFILNGLGTRGFTAGPAVAKDLVRLLKKD